MISSCMDCPGEVDGSKVDFNTPEFDIDNVDVQRLAGDHGYLGTSLRLYVLLMIWCRSNYQASCIFATL